MESPRKSWLSGAFLGAASAALLSISASLASAQAIPEGLAPLPDAPEINQARADLGKFLFFDNRMSGDTGNSCSTCHDPVTAWGDALPMSTGYTGVEYFRNAPALFNAANRNFFMWDGRLDGADLGTVVRDMLVESHTMQMDSRMAQERLKQVPEYAAMFEAAYGGDPYGGKMYGAIAEYLKTIRTANAPFDAYLRGDASAIEDAAKAGMEIFAGKAGCIQCHSGAMLSDGALHMTGAPDNPELQSNADRQITLLRFYATMGTPNYMNLRSDVGNYVVTKDEADIGKFATPSLWDVGQTGPYMHSGILATLEDVVAFYDSGGGEGPNKSPLLNPLGLTVDEKANLVAFLNSLTGDAPVVDVPELPDYQLRTAGQN